MNFDQNILKNDEKAVFALRELYLKNGYHHFKMNKFEEYDLYSRNKDFLVSEGVITFTDTDGKLLALKPDVTLSIINNSKDRINSVEKLYYNENVYRISEDSHTYKEIMQTGLECIGDIDESHIIEVVKLALESLSIISEDYKLCISHNGLITSLLKDCNVDSNVYSDIFTALNERNLKLLESVCSESQFEILSKLFTVEGNNCDLLSSIKSILSSKEANKAFSELEKVVSVIEKTKYKDNIMVDFSIASSDGYYSGIIFKGFVKGIATKVLSGGQYDKLIKKMGKNFSAIGFAVYLDAFERYDSEYAGNDDNEYINIALPKGRLGKKVYSMFEKAGFECPSINEDNRKLIFENSELKIRYFWVKPSDVAIYVERGAADIGVAGKDILLEYTPDVYELLDLNIGKCRMAVAAKEDFTDDRSKTLRVATKFSNIAKKYYAEKRRDIDIIHLNGSIELAPVLGLSDVIVDIVETGKTLYENNLKPFETIVPISARLISNKSSYNFKTDRIEEIKNLISDLVVKDND